MCKICPKCGAIAEFNAYYNRVTCTRCNWESEKSQKITAGDIYKLLSTDKGRHIKPIKVSRV